jgi:thymidylate synthase (FAD)
MNETSEIHGHGFVRLDGYMADDLSVVNAARVSFGARIEEMKPADEGLINFLMRERHGTPFEHNAFRFHIKCPIFVAREWFRHRIGSFNEISGRYTVLENHGYVPKGEYVREQSGKPGAYKFLPVSPTLATETEETISTFYSRAFGTYNYLLSKGVAKEIARVVLPVGTFTEFYWTVNARSLMNFLSLRTHETAQKEIQDYANAVSLALEEKMPITFASWIANGKVAP